MFLRKIKKKVKPELGSMPTCVIYTRVSSKEQVDNFSLDVQEKTCREYAAQNNLKILRVFREEGESAKTADREQLQLLLQYCSQHKWKIGKILVYKIDRVSRNTDDFCAIRLTLEKTGAILIPVTEPYEDTPYGRLVQNFLAIVAELDNNIRAQRTVAGMRASLLAGEWCWPAPLGYVNSQGADGKKSMEWHPIFAPIIQWMFEEYAKGSYTFPQIARAVNKKGLLSRHRKYISPQLVQKILTNPLYCGRIEKAEWNIAVEGKHAPLISEDLFLKVKRIMEGGGNKKLLRNRDNAEFPLRGLVCGECGGHLSGGRTKGRSRYYKYYACINKNCAQRRAIAKNAFENEFTEFLQKLIPLPEFSEALRKSINTARIKEVGDMEHTQKKIKKRIEQLTEEKSKLLRLKLDEVLSTDEFRENNDRLTLQIKALEADLQEYGANELVPESVIEAGLEILYDLPKTWRNIDVANLRVLRQQIFPENVVYTYPGFKTAKLSPLYKLSEEYKLDKNCLVTLRGFEPRLPP